MTQPLRRIFILVTTCVIAGLAAISLAGDARMHAVSSPAGTASLRAILNPETGKIDVGASAAAVAFDPDTEQALRRDTVGLTEERRADGTVLLDLQGRFQSVAMVHRGADGKLFVCTDNDARARDTLHGDLSAPAAPEVK